MRHNTGRLQTHKVKEAQLLKALKEAGIGSFTTFRQYIGSSSHYIYTCIVYTEERKERENSDTERPGIQEAQILKTYKI